MPLVTITTKIDFFPASNRSFNTSLQGITTSLGEDLPGLIVAHAAELHLDGDTTPEAGVQVDYRLYHPRAVNAVDIWLAVQFVEDVSDAQTRRSVSAALKKIILGWFETNDAKLPQLALDVFWGPGHGFLRLEDTSLDW